MKPPAISPLCNQSSGRLELSVYRADGATSAELWQICGRYVDDASAHRIAKARGTCMALAFARESLSFDADGKPHPRHANVVGWSEDMPKHELKNIQQRIAAEMQLELRNEA